MSVAKVSVEIACIQKAIVVYRIDGVVACGQKCKQMAEVLERR